MYKDHPCCIEPKNNAKIWRYMNLAKFTHLLINKSLYFCRLDRLGDPFEGSLTRGICQDLDNFASELNRLGLDGNNYRKSIRSLYKENNRLSFYVNCWYSNKHESDAMWKLYAGAGGGIAITSTIKRLKNCFCDAQESVFISKVKYIDYDVDKFSVDNCFSPVLFKRKSFSHDHELRAFVWDSNIMGKLQNHQSIPNGLSIQIELDELIDEIYISPLEKDWVASVVESLLKQYGLNKSPKHSKLSDSPLF